MAEGASPQPEPSIESRLEAFLETEEPAAPSKEAKPKGTEEPISEPQKPAQDTPEAPAASEAPAAEQEGDGTAPELRSVDDVAKTFGVEPQDFLGQIHVQVGDRDLTLQDLVTSYRSPESRSYEQQAKIAELDASKTALERQWDEKLGEVQALTGRLMKELESDQTDWARLKEEDPVQYSVKWAEKREKADIINASLQAQHAEFQRRQEDAKKSQEEFRVKERAIVEQRMTGQGGMPDMRNSATYDSVISELGNYLKSQGFKQEEINQLADHREILLAWKSKQFDSLQSKKPSVTKKVRALPKLIPPQARREQGQADSAKKDEIFKRLQETGDDRYAAMLFEDFVED